MQLSPTHLVLIPSYNPGTTVYATVAAARKVWSPVWVVVDGSTDGSTEKLLEMAALDDGLTVLVLPLNSGKGAAVLHGMARALQQGYTHVLTMDSDGQHDASMIPHFMTSSMQQPNAMILGQPVFDSSAPNIRVQGRKVANWFTDLETCWGGIADSLFGFRVYPMQALHDIMLRHKWMRRFDFDPEAAIRLCWSGVKPVNIATRVKYLEVDEGGVSHFNYWRDNKLLTWMFTRLFLEFLCRLPTLLWRKFRAS